MTKRSFPALLALGAVALGAATVGCVSDRPARNGVFDENQYLRKSFLIRDGNGAQADDGWMLRASFTQVSTPNPLGSVFIVPGAENGGQLVRFKVTQDKLQMVNQREISDGPAGLHLQAGRRLPEGVPGGAALPRCSAIPTPTSSSSARAGRASTGPRPCGTNHQDLQLAIAFAYANANRDARHEPGATDKSPAYASITGQISPTLPWADPMGFHMDADGNYVTGSDEHLKYTPFCRQGDLGVTPSEILANEIDAYESHYAWRNFRKYRKFWDDSKYAAGTASEITNMRRFIAPWIYDWSTAELSDTFRKIDYFTDVNKSY